MIGYLALIFILLLTIGIANDYQNKYLKIKEKYEDAIGSLPEQLARARKDALDRSRAVIKGNVSEHLAPYIPDFEHQPSDARFLGSPIDYMVFDGMSTGEEINVYIVDIKTGNSRLTALQRRIKKAVEEGRVHFETVRIK